VKTGKWRDVQAQPGWSYPSLKFICEHGQAFLDDFLKLDFTPSSFILQGKVDQGAWDAGAAVDRRVGRWCSARSRRTEEQYWGNPAHWGPFYLRRSAIRTSESLARCYAVVAERGGYAGATKQEVYAALETLHDALKDGREKTFQESMEQLQSLRDRGMKPPYKTLMVADPDYDWLSDVDYKRVQEFRKAIAEGKDPLDEHVISDIEDRVNPIDKAHPDTLLYFTYGTGAPRRMDGSEVPVRDLRRR
jgi:hypothetical protein